ncbi:MAG TPA: hypothetical protein VIJ46_02810, partial [Rhabdochlamydiaceae bacterium]
DAQLLGCPGEAFLMPDFEEGFELFKVHGCPGVFCVSGAFILNRNSGRVPCIGVRCRQLGLGSQNDKSLGGVARMFFCHTATNQLSARFDDR